MKKLTKKELWTMCIEQKLIQGDVSDYKMGGYLKQHLIDILNENENKTNEKKEGNDMKTTNTVLTIKKGAILLINTKKGIDKVKVIKVSEKTAVVESLLLDEGKERTLLLNILKSNLKKQDELYALLDEDDDSDDLDEVDDSDENDDETEDEDSEEDDDEDSEEDEVDDEPKTKKKSPSKKEASEPKKSYKYWENEDPILSEMENNEIRFYEDAGKLQLFQKVRNKKLNDGSKIIARGVTVDVGETSEKDAMKFIANIVYAMKEACDDDRLSNAIELLESLNEELNPEDYDFTADDLFSYDSIKLSAIAKNLGIKTEKLNKKKIVSAILKAKE